MAKGSIVKRNGGYTAVYDEPRPDEKRHQRWKGGFRNRAEAEAYLRKQLGKIDRGAYVSPTRITLAAFLTEGWLPSLIVRPSTRDSYERIVHAHIIPELGGIGLAKLGAERIGRFYRELVGLCQVGVRDRPGRRSQRGAGRLQRGQAPAQQPSRTCSSPSSCHNVRPTPPVSGGPAAPESGSHGQPRPG